MEEALTIVAILAGGLVIWAAPAVIMQHRIDKAFKRIGLSVKQFTYHMGRVKFAVDGTVETLDAFAAQLRNMGHEVEDKNSTR